LGAAGLVVAAALSLFVVIHQGSKLRRWQTIEWQATILARTMDVHRDDGRRYFYLDCWERVVTSELYGKNAACRHDSKHRCVAERIVAHHAVLRLLYLEDPFAPLWTEGRDAYAVIMENSAVESTLMSVRDLDSFFRPRRRPDDIVADDYPGFANPGLFSREQKRTASIKNWLI